MDSDSIIRYNVLFRPEPEGGYTAIVPSLPGCITYGHDLPEAKRMAEDAITGYLASLRKHHEPIPSDANSIMATIPVDTRPRSRKSPTVRV